MSEFNHAAHLRLALEYLADAGSLDDATDRIAAALRGKAAAAGHPEKYHHTVTVFWMRMLARLLNKDLPLAYFSPDRLSSEVARASWIEPDLRPLDDEGAR
jgi:hypothetical protein